MARVPKWVLNAIVWGDLTLQASQLATDPNPARNPNVGLGDIDINSLITDYFSLTDSLLQTYQPTADISPSLSFKPFATTTDKTFIAFYDANGLIQTIVPTGAVSIRGLQLKPKALGDNNTGVWFQLPGSLSNAAFLRIVFSANNVGAYTLVLGPVSQPGLPSGSHSFQGGQYFYSSSAASPYIDYQANAVVGFNRVVHRRFTLDSTLAPAINGDLTLGVATGPSLVSEIRTFEASVLAIPIALLDEAHTTAYQNNIGGISTPPRIALSGSPGTITNAAASQDHTHAPLAGTVVLFNADDTHSSATVPNADTNQRTYALGVNGYSQIIVEAEGYASFGVTSTNQVVNIKVKDGVTQKGQTMTVDAALGATSRIPFSIKASFVEQTAQTLAVTAGAAAADANTTIFLNSLRVYGVV